MLIILETYIQSSVSLHPRALIAECERDGSIDGNKRGNLNIVCSLERDGNGQAFDSTMRREDGLPQICTLNVHSCKSLYPGFTIASSS
jgi:hypothetical protein